MQEKVWTSVSPCPQEQNDALAAAAFLKPSLRYDYPLNAPNTVSRPIRDAEELFNVH